MKCPIARYECRRVEVKLTDGPVAAFQCIEQGGVRYMLLTPDAWARFEADWARRLWRSFGRRSRT